MKDEKKPMTREEEIEELLETGELGAMTECAYGYAIASTEHKNTLHKDTDKE